MRTLIALLLLLPVAAGAQSRSLAQFAIWEPKPGMEKDFEEGYKRHLDWHKQAGDTWNWYGWYFLSGPRAGMFIDASIDHAWSDFDHPVDPSGDVADNKKNTEPYGHFKQAFKLSAVDNLSRTGEYGMRAKYLRWITIEVRNEWQAKMRINRLKTRYNNKNGLKFFLTYKTIDGGRLDHWHVMIGADSWEDLEQSADAGDRLIDDSSIFKSISSEILMYRHDMSLFPK